MHATLPLLEQTAFPPISRRKLDTLQVNLGYKCNQSCVHCHVNAGPTRTEMMGREVADLVLDFMRASGVGFLDITGGAPELNPNFRYIVEQARAAAVRVMDRCNLTILSEPGQEELPRFLADHGVEVTASLPCYTEELVDRQRGSGVYERSIAGIRRLNALGYGQPGGALILNLVYNPQGPSLPPPQEQLEADYRRILGERFGIVFHQLFTLANMPIHRFGSMLVTKGQFAPYMKLLKDSYREGNLDAVMCRTLVSVDWQGYVYDCDFNQMLGLPLAIAGKPKVKLADLIGRDLEGNPIAVADHCFGCTAGQGSSCGGALGV
jgi:radical SAM/Cys-rich protein